MQHTPGPWRVAGLNVGSESNLVVASCYRDSDESVVMRPKTNEECLANARLIAAAPDLLKACKQAAQCLKDWIQTTGFGEVNKRDREALEAINLAISKVERES